MDVPEVSHFQFYPEQIILDLSNLRNKLLITKLILDYWETLDSTGNPGVLTIVCVPSRI